MRVQRSRLRYALLGVMIVILGLVSRISIMPDFVVLYIGDALYALLVYVGIAFLFRKMKPINVWYYSLAFCYSIEALQCYHAVWIDTIRNTTFGALVLGQGFLWSDIFCYTIGAGLGFLLEGYQYRREAH